MLAHDTSTWGYVEICLIDFLILFTTFFKKKKKKHTRKPTESVLKNVCLRLEKLVDSRYIIRSSVRIQ